MDVSTSGTLSEANYYHQFSVSFAYTTNDATTLVSQSNLVAYSQFGSTLYLSTDGSGVLSKSSDWADAGTAVTYVSPVAISVHEQYMINSADVGTNTVIASVGTGAVTANPEYYHQFSVIFQYSVTDGSPSAPTAYYTQFGGVHTVVAATDHHVVEWVDAGTAVSYDNPISASGTERWQANYAVVLGESQIVSSVSGSTSPIDPLYYHQFKVTFTYNVINGGGSPADAPYAYYLQFGLADNIQATGASDWVDNVSQVWYDNPVADSTSTHRWQIDASINGYGQSLVDSSVTASQTENPGYYNQFLATFSISVVNDASNVPSHIVGGYNQFGSVAAITSDGSGGVSPTSDWVDGGAAQLAYYIVPGGSGEQWSTHAMFVGGGYDIRNVFGSGTYSEAYYHQYDVTFDYTTSDGSSPASDPTVYYTQFGSTVSSYTANGWADWVDATSAVSYQNPAPGSGVNERWQMDLTISAGKSVVDSSVSGSYSENPTYYHQYKITFGDSVVNDASNVQSGEIGQYYQFGSWIVIDSNGAGAVSRSSDWVDADNGNGNIYYETVSASSTEQWASYNTYWSMVDTQYVYGFGSYTESYYHQYKLGFDYTVSDGNYPSDDPYVYYAQFGSTTTSYQAGEGWTDWVDALSSVS